MKLIFLPAAAVQSPEQIYRELIAGGYAPDIAASTADYMRAGRLYLDATNTYQVDMREAKHGLGSSVTLWHLSIKRVDREPLGDWRIKQAIKNALLGNECEAVELYPAESRLMDTANQYHLFGFREPWPKAGFPFGFTEGLVVNDPNVPRARQRPIED